jgi:ADP-ribose pyrophosphatase YjhB (NUDIX family)
MERDRWLSWARELQAIGQIGVTYARDPFDRQRFERLGVIATEIAESVSDTNPTLLRAVLENQTGYATPKVDVRAACFRNEEVLLVQERSDGSWTLPGGWADVNESATECVKREVLEESGFLVRIQKLAAVLDRDKHRHEPPFLFHVYKMFFVCEVVGGASKPSMETTAAEFFPVAKLPPLSISRVLPEQVRRMYEHWRNPLLPTDYD